jgi:hypothetical protein
MATGNVTVTTAANFIPEIWSKDAKIAVESNLVYAKRVLRQFEAELEFGDTLHIPDISNLTVGDKTANTDVTFETITEGKTDITVDKHKYAAFKIEDIVKIQANQDLMARYTGKIGYGLAKVMDSSLGALYSGFSQSVGTQGSAVSDTNIRRAVQYLDDADAPAGERSWVVKPSAISDILGTDKFVRADAVGYLMQMSPIISGMLARGESNPAEVKGYFGQIYGVSVFVSTNVASSGTSPITYHNLFFHREAMALVVQADIRVQTDYNIRSLADEVVGDVLYGVSEYRDAFGVDYLT